MQGLEKRASGDWIEAREASKDHDSLVAFFKIPPEQLKIQIDKLEFAVEHGVVEYKRTGLAPLFGMLDGAKFRSPALDEVRRQLDYTSALLFAMFVQKQLAEGLIKVTREKKQDEGISLDALDLTAILRDVNERIRKFPEFANNPLVKNIQLQAGQLRRERETMQKLLPTIKPEARDTFQQNYRKSFGEIIDKIKRSYAGLIKEENPETDEARPILAIVKLASLVPIVTDECQIVSRVRSTLLFAVEEKYRLREIFVGLATEKPALDKLFEREAAAYAKLEELASSERISGERSVARAFCAEMVRVLQKELTYRPAK
jgi:hypothetical protein